MFLRFHGALIAVLIGAACASTSEVPSPATLPDGRTWHDEARVGTPMSAPLPSGYSLDTSPASVAVERVLRDATTTAASLMVGGSHIGLCGRDGAPFLEGPLFGGGTR